jgi:hypothetical protein
VHSYTTLCVSYAWVAQSYHISRGRVPSDNAMNSDTYSAPLCAPNGARHRGR